MCLNFLCTGLIAEDLDSWSVKPLANDYYQMYRSPDPNGIYAFTPGLALCPNGRIIATYEINGPKAKDVTPLKGTGWGYVLTSDDHGKKWEYRNNFPSITLDHLLQGKVYMLWDRILILK
jgi:hypothetical protein